jgi:hypothetical protein
MSPAAGAARRHDSCTGGFMIRAEPGFRKEILTFEPRREVEDLRALGFPERIASLKILCVR